MNDQGYAATLEGFIARVGDLADKLRQASNASDELELDDLINELTEEMERAADFIQTSKGREL